jgi:hypothetical protein
MIRDFFNRDGKQGLIRGMLTVYAVAWLARVAVLLISPTEVRYLGEDWMHILLVAEKLGEGTLVRPFNPWGYPLLISPFVALGMDAFAIAFWVQPLLTGLIAPLAFYAVHSPHRVRRAWIAGLACAVYPDLVEIGCKMGWDAPYMVAVLASVTALLGRQPARPGLAGFLAATAWFLRTPGLAVTAGLFVVLIWRKQWQAARRFTTALVITVGLYTAAGTALNGNLVVISTHHEFLGNYRSEWGGWKRVIGEDERAERRDYLTFAWNHPKTFLRERAISIINFVTPWPFTEQNPVVKLVIFGPYLLLITATIHGLRTIGRRRRRLLLPVLAVVISTLIFHGMLFSKTRYRLPMLPPLIVFAVLAWPRRQSTVSVSH